MKSSCKSLGDITLAEVKAEGYRSMGAFVDAWIDVFGYWDPQQSLRQTQRRRIA